MIFLNTDFKIDNSQLNTNTKYRFNFEKNPLRQISSILSLNRYSINDTYNTKNNNNSVNSIDYTIFENFKTNWNV